MNKTQFSTTIIFPILFGHTYCSKQTILWTKYIW